MDLTNTCKAFYLILPINIDLKHEYSPCCPIYLFNFSL